MTETSKSAVLIANEGYDRSEVARHLDSHFDTVVQLDSVFAALQQRFNRFSGAPILTLSGEVDVKLLRDLAALKAVQPGAHLMLLTERCSESDGRQAHVIGVDALLPAHVDERTLLESLASVAAGHKISSFHARPERDLRDCNDNFPAEASDDNGSPEAHVVELNETDLEILACLLEGLANREIAARCGVSEASVKIRLRNLLSKIGAANRTQAAVWAVDYFAELEAQEQDESSRSQDRYRKA